MVQLFEFHNFGANFHVVHQQMPIHEGKETCHSSKVESLAFERKYIKEQDVTKMLTAQGY